MRLGKNMLKVWNYLLKHSGKWHTYMEVKTGMYGWKGKTTQFKRALASLVKSGLIETNYLNQFRCMS